MPDLETFRQTLKEVSPLKDWPEVLKALWWDAKDDWQKAHETAQEVHDAEGSWVHAYLHRKEGDEWNAGYWYSRAGKTKSKLSLEAEWEEITAEMLRKYT